MKRKHAKDIKPYVITYVILSIGTLFIAAQIERVGGFGFGFTIYAIIWFVYWLILNGVFGYIIKDKLQPKYRENILADSFLWLHITSSFFFSFMVFISDPSMFVLLMSFIMYFLVGLLFAGGPFAIGTFIARNFKNKKII